MEKILNVKRPAEQETVQSHPEECTLGMFKVKTAKKFKNLNRIKSKNNLQGGSKKWTKGKKIKFGLVPCLKYF